MSKKLHKESRYEKECKALRKKAKRRAKLYTFALFCVIALSLTLSYTLVLRPTQEYETALKEMESGAWQSASARFLGLGSIKDAKRLAAFTNCVSLFNEGSVKNASEVYLTLGENDQQAVQERLGTFAARAESAMDEGRYSDAYVYYSLDLNKPERDDAMYSITVYSDSQKLLAEKRYDEARGEISACLEVSHALSAPLQTLLDSSYQSEFDYYDSFTVSDLAFAVKGMEALEDEYEPAHIYLRDLRSAYYGGVLSMNEGKYANAIRQFEDITAYADTAQKLDECRMLLANQQAEAGETQAAIETAHLVVNWQDYMALLPEDNSLAPLLLASEAPAESADELAA